MQNDICRNSSKAGKITLDVGGRIINAPAEVATVFNEHFVSVANLIGINDPLPEELHGGTSLDAAISKHDIHESINLITRNVTLTEQFRFKRVTHKEVLTRLTKINVKKAVGPDGIPPKISEHPLLLPFSRI